MECIFLLWINEYIMFPCWNEYIMLTVEAQKQVNDYKFRLNKAEQDITMLEGNVSWNPPQSTAIYFWRLHTDRIEVIFHLQ